MQTHFCLQVTFNEDVFFFVPQWEDLEKNTALPIVQSNYGPSSLSDTFFFFMKSEVEIKKNINSNK